jgi:NADH:ubiquinone oxidoreductase subunit 5 (subunit L)/multisubunit Na+/H+ antiporter MnhA subunit
VRGTLTTNGRVESEAIPEIPTARDEDALRKLAVRHLEHVRKFKLYLSIYMLSMLVLTPVWIVTQYETQDGWLEHLSSRSRYPGDWDPWIIWVALVGAVLVAIAGFRAYFSRANTEEEIKREIERLQSTH